MHDATIEAIEQKGANVRVRIRGYDGHVIRATFRGVTEVLAQAAEGMTLYVLSELEGDGAARRFVFSNWYDVEEEDFERHLEITAADVDFRVEDAGAGAG